MEQLFYQVFLRVQRNKALAVLLAIAFLLSCGFLAFKIRFDEDITQLIPKNERTDELAKALQQVNFADKITLLVETKEGGTLADATGLASQLLDSLQRDTAYIQDITGRFGQEDLQSTYDFVYKNLPLFLDTADYKVLAEKSSRDAIAKQEAENYRSLLTPTGFVLADFIQKDPLGFGLLALKKLQDARVGQSFILYDGFIATADSSKLLLFISPTYQGAETVNNEVFVKRLNGLKTELNKQFAARAELSYFGSAFVAVANAQQIRHDIMTTVLLSMSVLMVLLVVFYRRFTIPILVFIPTLFAGLFAIACLYLYKPVISAISLSIGAVLIGITIDYALHILTHYKKTGDSKALYKELTRPILMSGATNAVAFLCLLFVHSEALVDLGIFASISIFASAVFSLLIIPHLYTPKQVLHQGTALDRLAAFPFERSRILQGICVLLLLVSVFTSTRVGFNNSLSDLNYFPEDLKAVEVKLDKLLNTNAKSLYLVSTGKSFDEAAAKAQRLQQSLEDAKNKKQILGFSGLGHMALSPAQQQHKFQYWNSFWTFNNRKEQVQQDLMRAGEPFGFRADAHQAFYDLLAAKFTPLSIAELSAIPALGFRDFVAERAGFYTISTLVKVDEAERSTFLAALHKQQDVLVLDRQGLNESFLGNLKNDFNRLVQYSFIAVLLILWLFFRRLELVILSAIPIGLTALVTAGLMGALGLDFNIFSAIVCTLVFGHGVDFSIFMTAALQKQYSTGEDDLKTYRTSILLAVLTTVLAIGALVFAKHPALLSISLVSLIGVFAAVLITFVFYPLLFRFFIADRAKRGKSPYTVFKLLRSLIFFAYFGLGSLLVSFVGRFCLAILPLGAARRELLFRSMVSRFMKSVLHLHSGSQLQVYNPFGEPHAESAIYIANHASFLDILAMGMLFPKAIFLVNDWVWTSPIFGKAIQALGFYPISQGVHGELDHLQKKLDAGYSFIVFPEGTRSANNRLKRFHKGAFYIAEKLQMPIVPVYLHGFGDVLPKNDFLIFNGSLTITVGQRIPKPALTAATSYAVQTKVVAKMFKEKLLTLRSELEAVDYFREKLILAYRYKDADIMAAVQKNIDLNKATYFLLNTLIDPSATVTLVSSSYGEFAYLLSLQQGQRKVVGILADAQQCQVAQSIYWYPRCAIRFTTQPEQLSELVVFAQAADYKAYASADFTAVSTIYLLHTDASYPELKAAGFTEETISPEIRRFTK